MKDNIAHYEERMAGVPCINTQCMMHHPGKPCWDMGPHGEKRMTTCKSYSPESLVPCEYCDKVACDCARACCACEITMYLLPGMEWPEGDVYCWGCAHARISVLEAKAQALVDAYEAHHGEIPCKHVRQSGTIGYTICCKCGVQLL